MCCLESWRNLPTVTDPEFRSIVEAYDDYFMSLYEDLRNPFPLNHDFLSSLIHRENQSNQELYLQLRQQYRQR